MKKTSDVNVFEEVFYRDGSLRDIYVLPATVDDWQKFITYLQARPYPFTYELEGVETPLSANFSEMQKRMGKQHQLLSIYVQRVRVNCHFFGVEDIELDLLPDEVETEEQAEAIFEFMVRLGRVLEKEVILTPENEQECIIVRYNPKVDEIEYQHD